MADPKPQDAKKYGEFDKGQSVVPKKGLKVSVGASGTNIFSGIIDEEHNSDLIGMQKYTTFDTMYKQDAKVRASLRIILLPLLAANWSIVPVSDDKEDLEKAEFARQNMFEKIDFRRYLRESINGRNKYGFYLHEKVWEIDDQGKIVWKAFEPRLPRTVLKWEMQSTGAPGITQQLSNYDPRETKNPSPEIPANKLIHFVNDREGDNYEGISLLRSAYKHWFIKDKIYLLQAIGIERFLVGLPVISMDSATEGTPEYDLALELVEQLHGNEKSGLVKDKEWDFEIIQNKAGGEQDMAEFAVNHHDSMISMNVLAPFLDLGGSGSSSGSFALSKTLASFFVLQELEEAKDFEDVTNEAIKELFEMNGVFDEKYPTLKGTNIENMDLDVLAKSLDTLINAGVVDVDVGLKRHAREAMNLPDKNYDDEEEMEGKEEAALMKKRKEDLKAGILPKQAPVDDKDDVDDEKGGEKPDDKNGKDKKDKDAEEEKDIEKAVKKVKKENPEMDEGLIRALFFEDDETFDKTMTNYLKNQDAMG